MPDKKLAKLEKHHHDGMVYASMVQRALLPGADRLVTLGDYFIIWRPLDIVSGDFYYYHNERKHVIVAADSTGHGPAGAMMAAIGNGALNSVIIQDGITRPDIMLQELNSKLYEILGADVAEDDQIRNSIDMSVCRVDQDFKLLEFAGANRPLWILRKGDIQIFPKTRSSVGGDLLPTEKKFELHEFNLEPGDQVYMWTDGITDQFGGVHPGGKKAKPSNLKKWILETWSLPTDQQKARLEAKMDLWQGKNPQTDDMLLMSFRVPG